MFATCLTLLQRDIQILEYCIATDEGKAIFCIILFCITYLKISLLNIPEVVLVNDLRTISLSVAQDLCISLSLLLH